MTTNQIYMLIDIEPGRVVVGGQFDAAVEPANLDVSLDDREIRSGLEGDMTATIDTNTFTGFYDPEVLEADIDTQELC